MIFRSTTLDSVFVSAVAAGALVAATTVATSATADNDVTFKDSVAKGNDGRLLWSSNDKNANDILHYVPSNIPDNRILLENNRSKKTFAKGTTRRLLRNNNLINDGGVGVGDKPVDRDDTIDLGILDKNAVPADTKGELDLHRELSDLDAYCDSMCPSPRKKIPYGTNIQSLVSFCDTSDECGDCSGDGDDIDYRCPSQVKCWKTSAITDMQKAFYTKTFFNEPLRCWDVSSVTDMSKMFYDAFKFSSPIDSWDVSSVTDMSNMFYRSSFDQPLESWVVSSVTDMSNMFSKSTFRQPLDSWDVSSVTDMNYMFYDSRCNQPLESWDVSSVTAMRYMFFGSGFNQPLDSWDVSSVTDMSYMFFYAKRFDQPLESWDVSYVTTMASMFCYAESFDQPLESWDVSSVTSMESMFRFARYFDQPLESWDVSSVTSMESMFANKYYFFDQPLESWDVSSVTTMKLMFYSAWLFDQPLESWDVSSVTTMAYMFYRAEAFNSPLDSWDVSSVTSMKKMLKSAYGFDQCLSSWAIKTTNDPESLNVSFMFASTNCPNKGDPDLSNGPWCQYSSDYCSSCYDDPGFRFEGQDSKNCDWAALELSEQSCLKEGVSEGCPRTCSPVCSGTTCVNDPDFRLGGVKAKSCEWVAKQKTNERCKKPGVFAACPETCNPVCATVVDCTDDQDFQLNGLKGKNCKWVAKQKTYERCKKTGVMASCRRTCNPKCGCRDSMDEFQFQGSTITCKDLDIINCDAEPTPSSDEFTLAQLMQLQALLDPIHQRLDAIAATVVEEGSEMPKEVGDTETFRDLCPNKCQTCV